MENTGNAGGGTGKVSATSRIDLYQEIIDFFRSRAGRIFREELELRVESSLKELQNETNKRDRDMILKGRIAEGLWILNTPERLRSKAKDKGE